ncbi:aminopeptidase [bacterium]|nr:aminopeptidase [candidate division CSSED10-310 bacterium]
MDLSHLAYLFINDALMIKENEVVEVTLTGERHYFPFLDEFTLNIAKSGAYPTIRLNTPSYRERFLRELPISYLSRTPPQALKRIHDFSRHINIICSDPDPKFKNIPKRKYQAAIQARRPVIERIQRRNMSNIYLPTPELAQYFNVPESLFIESVHNCLNISYRTLRSECKTVSRLIRNPNRMVEIHTHNHCKLTFQLSDRQIFSQDGSRNLPGGYVFISPLENSVEGTILIDSLACAGKTIQNLLLTFKSGRIESCSADLNLHLFQNRLNNAYGDKDVFAGFGIGLNPGITAPLSCEITDPMIRGSIHICLGSNLIFGGNNFSDLFWPMTAVHPTVLINGQEIIRNGEFVPELN